MRDIALAIVMLGLLPKCYLRPEIGVMVFCWLSYMNPHRLCYGFAMTFPWAQLTAVLTIAGLMVSKEPKKVPWNATSVLLLIFLAWMFITTLFALNPEAAWVEWNTVWKIQLMTFLMMILINTKERINQMVWVMALSLGFYGFKGGLFTLVSGGGARVWGPAGTFIGGNNEIGLAMLMTIPLLRYLQLISTNFWIKQGLTAGMVLSFLCTLGTQSRGALLGAAAMTLFLVLKSRNKFPLLLLLVVLVPSALTFMPQKWYDRMNTIKTYQQDASAMGRINAWHTSVNIAQSRLVGGGYKCLHSPLTWRLYSSVNDLHDAHSIYFEVIAEHGLIGFALFMGIGITTWRTASRTIKLAKQSPDTKWMVDLCSMIQVSFVGYAVGGLFLGLAMFDLYYNMIAIIIACSVYLKNRHAAPLADTDPAPAMPVALRRRNAFVKPPIGNARGANPEPANPPPT